MKALYSIAILVVVVSVMGCLFSGEGIEGNGELAKEDRKLGKVSKLKVYSMDVVIDSGASAVKVEADENLLPYIETKRDGDYLVVKFRNNISVSTENPVKIYITTPELNAVDIAGSGNVSSEDKFWSRNGMRFNISGDGDISLNVNAPSVKASISGSGNLHLSGETQNVDVDISGSGNYRGKDLKAENADLKIMGSGDAETFADVRLKASIMGSGSIRYQGNANVDKSIKGSGSVDRF